MRLVCCEDELQRRFEAHCADDKRFSASLDFGNSASTPIYDIQNGEAVIRVEGYLKETADEWERLFGVTAYSDIRAALDEAKAAGAEKIVLAISSGGGEVAGVQRTWEALRTCGLSTEARVMGTAASAAYWLATGCKKITLAEPTTAVGSIGCICTVLDGKGEFEKNGAKLTRIVSGGSPAKSVGNKEYIEGMQQAVDAMAEVFVMCVAQGRGVTPEAVKSDFGKGALIIGNSALDKGMADAIFKNETENEAAASPSNITIKGETIMTFEDLQKTNPEVVGIVDAKVKSEVAAAVKAESDKFAALVAKVTPFITSEEYPAKIKAIASDVLAGKNTEAALDAAIVAYDAVMEQKKSEAAAAESGAQGGLAASAPKTGSEEDEARARIKAAYEAMGVK